MGLWRCCARSVDASHTHVLNEITPASRCAALASALAFSSAVSRSSVVVGDSVGHPDKSRPGVAHQDRALKAATLRDSFMLDNADASSFHALTRLATFATVARLQPVMS
jgi:hypothetical protein